MNNFDGYTVVLKEIIEEDDSYWVAYHPEFGFCACSGCGDTPEEALNSLNNTRKDIINYYSENKKYMPLPFDTNTALYEAKWTTWVEKTTNPLSWEDWCAKFSADFIAEAIKNYPHEGNK